MAESDPILAEELISPEVFTPTIEQADILEERLVRLEAGILRLFKASSKELQLPEMVKPKTVEDVEKLNAALKKIEELEKRLTQVQAQSAAIQKTKASGTKTLTLEQAKLNQATAESNRITKANAILATAAEGSYKQLSAQLTKVSIRYKEVSEAHRENTVTGRLLAEQKLVLTERLKALDAQTGVYSRNVGNYRQALTGLGHVVVNVAKLLGVHTEGLEELEHVVKQATGAAKGFEHVMHTVKHAEDETIETTKKGTEENVKSKASWTGAAAGIAFWLTIAAAVAAITYAIIEAIIANTEAEKERNKAVDGAIIKNKELREEHNKMVFELQRLDIEYKKVTGRMNDFDATIAKLQVDYSETLNTIMKETKEKLEEGIGFWEAFGLLWKKGLLSGTEAGMERRNEIISEYQNKALDEQKKKIKEIQIVIEEDRKYQEDQLLQLKRMQNDATEETTQKKIEALKIDTEIAIRGIHESNALESTKNAQIVALNEKLALDIQHIWRDIALKKKQIDEQIYTDTIERQKRVLQFNASRDQVHADLTIANDVDLANVKLKIRRDLQLELDAIDSEALLRASQLRVLEIKNSTEDEGVKAKQIMEVNVKLQQDLSRIRETSEQREIDDQEKTFAQLEKMLDEEAKREIDRIKKVNAELKREREAAFADEQKLRTLQAHTSKEKYTAELTNQRELNHKLLEELDAQFEGGIIKQEEYERKREIITREGQDKINSINREFLSEQLEVFGRLENFIKSALDARIQYQQNILNRETQEIDRSLALQQDLFNRNLDNQLAFAERRKAESIEKQAALDKKAQKEKELEQLAEVFLELMKVYAKDGQAGFGKAVAETFLVQAFKDGLKNSFKDGVEDLKGPGTETSDSIWARLSRGESVATARGTKDNPGLVTAMNTGQVGEWFNENYRYHMTAPIVPDATADVQVLKAFTGKVDELKQEIRNNKPAEWNRNEQDEWTKREVRNGIARHITYKKRVF